MRKVGVCLCAKKLMSAIDIARTISSARALNSMSFARSFLLFSRGPRWTIPNLRFKANLWPPFSRLLHCFGHRYNGNKRRRGGHNRKNFIVNLPDARNLKLRFQAPNSFLAKLTSQRLTYIFNQLATV